MAVTIFVVDDDEDSRYLLAELLKSRGFATITASCGTECLEALDAPRGDTPIVLTDLEMPGMTGLELCATLRARYPGVVSIILSGRATGAVAAQAKESGAFAFLPKPVHIRTLDRLLREIAHRMAT